MSKQTAVNWVVEQVEQHVLTHGNLPFNVLSKIKKQADAMFERQIIAAHNQSFRDRNLPYETAIKYYNQTYKTPQL